jgi:hypothetical protein
MTDVIENPAAGQADKADNHLKNKPNRQPDTTTWDGVEQVVRELFGDWPDRSGGVIWTAGFRSAGGGESWHGRAGLDWLRQSFGDMRADVYVCIGVMAGDATRRSNSGVVAQPLLIVDDVGTKVDPAKWEDMFAAGCPRPTLQVETSPGNQTWFWALAGDAKDPIRWSDLALIRAYLVDGKLTDEVMDPARYVRLPCGWNSKPKYRGPNGDGSPPKVRLIAWRLDTDGRVDVDRLGEAIVGSLSGVSVMGPGHWRSAPPPKSTSAQALLTSAQIGAGAGALVRTADLSKPDALLRLADEIGMHPQQVRPGVVEALCPNIGAHTARAETGFAFLGQGLMHCNHASCQALTTADFRAMMAARMDEKEGREGAGVEWLAREEMRDAGGLEDTATVLATAGAMAAASQDRAQLAAAQAVAQTRDAIVGAAFSPVAPIMAAQIPPRRWYYGRAVIAGFLSFLVAPGGAKKSTVAMVRAVAMSSGRELLPGEKPVRPLRVWVHNAEDDLAEMQRRHAAVLQHFDLSYADLNGNLFMTSGRDMKLQLARTGRDGPEVVPGVVDALVERLVTAKIDVLILDPLGALHTLPENSNEAANLLSGALREVAHRADTAVVVLHHAGKAAAADMDAAGAGASRGASAFVDAARVVEQLIGMTEKEAARYGIAEADRRDYLRIENGKANLARAEGGRWLRTVDVPLGNGMGLWPLGDRVGVVERWAPPTAQSATNVDLARVQATLMVSPRLPRADYRSPEWIGWLVGTVMGLDTGGPSTPKEDRTPAQNAALARVRAIVAGWVQSGGLVEREEKDPDSRKPFRFVYVGTPAVVLEETAADADAEVRLAENAE